jgi:cellulose synthase (UDP-forming)
VLVVLAVVWTAVYLVWRIGWSWDDVNPVLWSLLLVAELAGWCSLLGLAWFGWHHPRRPRPPVVSTPSVDIYVCTYDEPIEVLLPTLEGCAAVRYPHTTYLLDDGRRPEMADLAERCGARYLTRPDNRHAKAGNINHALHRTTGDLVFVLDADHVPLPDALDAVVGYFEDPDLAVVQTPHGFYNDDSFQHYDTGRHEQSVFFEVILPGKDRHGAAFWCGSAAVIRRAALVRVGGVATETIAEDFHTTIKLQREGWTTAYHHEHLVQGLAPHDLAAYLLQRDRWARGNLSVVHTPESPLRARELTGAQRWSYAVSLFAYLAGPIRALLLTVLAIVVWTGELPLRATPLTLGLLWGPSTLLLLLAGSALTRGYMRIKEATHFELLTAQIHLRALSCLVKPSRAAFKVTPKEGVDTGGWARLRMLPLVVGLAAALGLGLVARLLAALGWLALPGLPGIAAWVVPALTAIELRRVLRTLRYVGDREQVRLHTRFPLEAPVQLVTPDRIELVGTTADLSATGLAVSVDRALSVGSSAQARIELPPVESVDPTPTVVEVGVRVVRAATGRDGSAQLGLRIESMSFDAHRAIVRACFVGVLPGLLRRVEPGEDGIEPTLVVERSRFGPAA